MAKAFEWANKFVKATDEKDCEAILNEYKFETEELINLRTKNSKDEYKSAAKDGAIREQRQKFASAIRNVSSFNMEMFDKLVNEQSFPKTYQEVLPRTELVIV